MSLCCEVTYGLLEVRLSFASHAGQGESGVIYSQAQDRTPRNLSGGIHT